MKKNLKRIMALVVAMMMAIAMMSVSAFAAAQTYTITIDQKAEDTGSHTYGAYQIFAGDLSSDGKTISNITWGSGVDAAKISGFTFADKSTATDIAAALTTDNAAQFATAIQDYLGTAAATASTPSTGDSKDVKLSGLAAGYYLVKDTVAPTGQASQTAYILKVVADQTVEPKSSVPTHEKKVDDVNDTTGDETKLRDSADYDIGDKVPYTLTSTLGTGMDNYKSYSVKISDKMCAGLTYQNDAVITLDGKDVTDKFTAATPETGTDGYTTYAWSCDDIKALGAHDGSKIVVKYTAELNSNAVIGSAGNPNESWLQYDNNPNESGKGTPGGKTPHDKNIVFTYKVDVNKIDKDGNPLKGAEFTLYKKIKGTEDKAIAAVTLDDDKTKFEFKGLDDGTYVLKETKVPDGYNKIDDVEFTITAEHELNADDPQLTKLNGVESTGEIDLGTAQKATVDKNAGSITSNIKNFKGSSLPTTGGIGTTIFYILGAILVAGAAVVLVARKRSEN